MNNQTKYIQPTGIFNAATVYLLIAISGLSFCFFLGFPFDNHNESYLWIVLLNKNSFWDIVSKKLTAGIETLRPLGMANAYLSYHLSGNIYLQQILNWLLAASSFIVVFNASCNKILFAFLSLIITACFFSGYIYLFHLHGVFYGPFQLYVAVILSVASKNRRLSNKMLAIISAATFIVSLYHTFALLIFCAFLAGYLLQLPKKEKFIEFAKLILIILATISFAALFLKSKEIKTLSQLLNGFLVSYRLTEVKRTMGIISLALALITVVPAIKKLPQMVVSIAVIIILAAIFFYANIPLLILWIIVCLVKTMIEKNWAMAGIIASTAILPLGSSTGSPTYIVFVLMVCAFVTADNKKLIIPDTIILRQLSAGFLLLLCICLPAIKAGIQVPVATYFARPLLAEQEKTQQLKDILSWKLKNKDYETYSLTLYDSANPPVSSTNSANRVNRPVTDQQTINAYIDFVSDNNTLNEKKAQPLYVTFGNKILQNSELVFSVEGKWNGKACVFLSKF